MLVILFVWVSFMVAELKIWQEGISIEELPSADWPKGKSVAFSWLVIDVRMFSPLWGIASPVQVTMG